MPRDNEPAIEVEVLEIDGEAPPPPRDPASAMARIHDDADDIDDDNNNSGQAPNPTSANWHSWPRQLRTLPPWYLPLLIIGGTILLGLILTLGVLVAALILIYRIVRGLLRSLFQ